MVSNEAATAAALNLLSSLMIKLRDKGLLTDRELEALIRGVSATSASDPGAGGVKELLQAAFPGARLD